MAVRWAVETVRMFVSYLKPWFVRECFAGINAPQEISSHLIITLYNLECNWIYYSKSNNPAMELPSQANNQFVKKFDGSHGVGPCPDTVESDPHIHILFI
jgi:hypothetical protein